MMDIELSEISKKAKRLGEGGFEKLSRAQAEYKKGYKIIKNKYDNNDDIENNDNLYNILIILIGVLTTYGYKEEKKRKEIISKIHNYQKQLESNVKPKSTKDIKEKIKFYIASFDCFYNIGVIFGILLESITKSKDIKTNPYPIINQALDYFYQSKDNKNAHFYASKLKDNGIIEYYSQTIESVSEIYCNENVEQWDMALSLYRAMHESQDKTTSNQYFNLGKLSLDCNQYGLAIEFFTSQLVLLKKQRNTAAKLECLKLLLECYFSIGNYDKFDEIMEQEILKNFESSYDELSEQYNVKQSLQFKELRLAQEVELKSIPESNHEKRIPVIESILSLLCQEKEEEVYYIDEKLKCYISLEECFKGVNNYQKLNQIYEEHSFLLDHQVSRHYFKQSSNLNKLIITHCKSNVLFGIDYNLKILYIIAKINLSNALDNLDNGHHQKAIDHLMEAINELKEFNVNELNHEEHLTVLDNTKIATSNIATIYRKLGDDKKYNSFTKKKEQLEFDIQELKSNQPSSQLSIPRSRSKIGNSQSGLKKTEDDYTDDNDEENDHSQYLNTSENLSLENLSVEDIEQVAISPIKRTTTTTTTTTTASTNTSTKEIIPENERKNKLESLIKRTKEKTKVANEIASEEYLQQIQINENNKRELYDSNSNSNVHSKKTRRTLVIESEYETKDGVEISKCSGLPIDLPANKDDFIIYSKDFPPPPSLTSPSKKNNNNEPPQTPGNIDDPIIINDGTDSNRKKPLGFRLTTPEYEKEFLIRQANEDFEEDEYHPPEHYDANGVLLPCHTSNFIVPDEEEEEEDNYYGDKPKKKKSSKRINNNNNNNTSTNTTSPVKSNSNNNISNVTSPTKSSSTTSYLSIYKHITVTIFLDILIYIPIFGADSKQLDLQWLKERVEDRIKLMGYDDFNFEIDFFSISTTTIPIPFKTKVLDVMKSKNFKQLKSHFKDKSQEPELMEDLDILNNNDELSNGFHCDDNDENEDGNNTGLVIGDSNLIQVLTLFYMETFKGRKSLQSMFVSDLRLSSSNLVISQISQLLSTCPNINSLSFINCGLNKDSMNKLSNSIQSLKSITKLNLSLNHFSGLESFPHIASITHLDLSGCNLSYISFKVIYDSLLSISNSLVVLKLNENPDIGNRGFSLLTSDQGRLVLSRLIQFEIRLSLGNLDIGTLGKLFKCCSIITTLDIGNNSIGSGNGSKLKEITNSLSPSSIINYNTDINNGNDDEEIMGFNSISKLTMDEIDLPNLSTSNNNQNQIQSICKLIENSNKLVYLKLQNNNIGLFGSKLLVKHLPLAKLLSKLLLRSCNLTMIGIFTILYNCLNSNPDLKYLDLSRNTNTDDEVNNSSSDINSLGVSIKMFDSKPNLNIEYLNLSENNIDYDHNKNLEPFKLKWKLYNYKSPLSESSTLIFENN